jgi:uncharacterized membrane protein
MPIVNLDSKDTHPLHHDSAPYWFGDQPAPFIRAVTVDQSSRWLARGWNDLWAAPGVSLTYGMMFVVAAYLIFFGLSALGMESLVLPLAAGFILIGPLAAVGLYDVSRRHAAGEPVTMAHALATFRHRAAPLMVVGLSLMMTLLAWMMVAFLIFASFYHEAPPPIETFISSLLIAPQAPLFLLVGTVAGGVIAAVTFAISAISLPLIVDRNVSPVYAMATSVKAVAKNWRVMIGWAAMIALVTGFGLATFFVGLVVALPLIGHASWHAYKAMIE